MLSKNVWDKIDLQHFGEEDENNSLPLETVKTFLESKKEDPEVLEILKTIVPEKPVDSDVVKGFLETKEGLSILQPKLDSFATKAIQTHDEKNKKAVEAEIARRVNEKLMELNKEDTPEQRQIKEQALRMKELEEKYENDKKIAKINEIAYKEGINPEFVEGISFKSSEEFALYANRLKDFLKKERQKAIDEFVAANSFKPKGGSQNDKDKVDLSSLTQDQLIELEMSGKLDSQITA